VSEEYGDAYPVEVQWRRPRRVTAADVRRRVVLLPGDGIGPEIVAATRRLLDRLGEFEFTELVVGGASIDEHGTALTDDVLDACRRADAVLLGAVGGPKWDTTDPDAPRPEQGLLGLRKGMGLYANLRPVRPSPALVNASPLRQEVIAGTDLLVVRELTGGIYFGSSGREGDRAHDDCEYTVAEIERIARVGFEAARRRGGDPPRVTSVDKANVLETSRLWRETVVRVAGDYDDVELDHMLVDNAAMQLVANPARFDVIVTENMFGDILSDESAMLTGSLGMLPSASLGAAGEPGLFEPVHGSAPDIATRGIANPLATFLSAAMMLRHGLGMEGEARAIETAVDSTLERGLRTPDLATAEQEAIGTDEMTDAVVEAVRLESGV
jgi:3-isopropylmalate dehydrogenase